MFGLVSLCSISSENCGTTESWKICNFDPRAIPPESIRILIQRTWAICLKLAIFHVKMSNLPNSAWSRCVKRTKEQLLSWMVKSHSKCILYDNLAYYKYCNIKEKRNTIPVNGAGSEFPCMGISLRHWPGNKSSRGVRVHLFFFFSFDILSRTTYQSRHFVDRYRIDIAELEYVEIWIVLTPKNIIFS